MFEHYKEAQTCLERATSIDPHSVVAWTLLGEMKDCYLTSCWATCDPAANRAIQTTTTNTQVSILDVGSGVYPQCNGGSCEDTVPQENVNDIVYM